MIDGAKKKYIYKLICELKDPKYNKTGISEIWNRYKRGDETVEVKI